MTSLQRQGSTDLVEIDGGELVESRAVTPTALEAITRAELDSQISTAKRFPRSIQKFMAEAKGMVAIDPDLAAQCTYTLPARRGSRDNAPVTGPSVRLAEVVALCWGNIRISGRITDDNGTQVTAQAIAMDLERNVGYSVEVKRNVVTRDGRRFGDDLLKTTQNAALAIATRNATFKVVPRAFVSLIEDEAQRVARGDVRSLPDRTARAVNYFVGKGIGEERIYAALGIAGPADMTLDLLGKLNGFKVAVNESHATLDDIFPKPHHDAPQAPDGPPPASRAEGIAQRLKGEKGKATDREPGMEG